MPAHGEATRKSAAALAAVEAAVKPISGFSKAVGVVGKLAGDVNDVITGTLAGFLGGGGNNKIDGRIQNGLDDLLAGILGVRTSKVPEIKSDVLTAKEADRRARLASQVYMKKKAHGTIPEKNILQFPEAYFNEQGDVFMQYGDAIMDEETGQQILDENGEPVHETKAVFPNSIHFRSIKRQTIVGLNEQDANKIFDIFLYLPHNLNDSIKVNYAEGKIDLAGTLGSKGVAWLFNESDEVTKFLGGIKLSEASAEGKALFRQNAPGSKILQSAVGHMVNPIKFQALEGVPFRSYSYKFTLRPTTSQEAIDIREIIAAFKWSTLPGVAGAHNMIWTYPNEWAIRFKGPIRDWIDFPLTCVCTSVDVDYSGGGATVVMSDGAPAAIMLTVSFIETTQMSREKFTDQVSAQNYETRDEKKAGMRTDAQTLLDQKSQHKVLNDAVVATEKGRSAEIEEIESKGVRRGEYPPPASSDDIQKQNAARLKARAESNNPNAYRTSQRQINLGGLPGHDPGFKSIDKNRNASYNDYIRNYNKFYQSTRDSMTALKNAPGVNDIESFSNASNRAPPTRGHGGATR